MQSTYLIKPIAHIHSDFPDKFGIPRQSGLVNDLKARIIFDSEFRRPEAFRGLSDYSHIWLIWAFSKTVVENWSPLVRPPRLGGNTHMGVFATRSPYRPNPIGLSSVKLEKIEIHPQLGPILHVLGADLMDKTPIFDIKPYIPHIDSHPDADAGFSASTRAYALSVECPDSLLAKVPADRQKSLLAVLAQDPRPSYQNSPERIYGLRFAGLEIKFRVENGTLYVCSIYPDKC